MRSQLKGSVAVLALLSAPVWAQDAPAEAGAGMTAEMCAPVVTVTQTPPEVRITMGDDPEGDPQVVVIQSPPTVEVEQCPPVFSGIEGDIAITEAEPEIVVNAAESAELVVTRRSDAAAGEAAEAEATEPEMTEPEAAEPEAAADAPAEAEGQSDEMPAEAEETQPPATTLNTEADEQPDADAGAAETGATETDAPEADAPETDAAEAGASDTGASDTGAAETEVIDTEAPEAEGAQTEMPEADTAEADAAEADAAEAEAAEAEAPDADADTPADDTPATPAPEAATQDPTPAEAGAEPGQAVLREGNSAISAEEAMTADLEGVSVITSDDETAGEITAVDAQAGLVILSVGGILGMGQRDVAVPLDQISFQRDADGELQVYLPFPSAEVEDLPEHEAAE